MQVISFFSGIARFEIASQQMGWDNIFSCEINPYGQQVLKHHFPNAYHHDNIKTFNIETLKKSRWNPFADSLVCGGFP